MKLEKLLKPAPQSQYIRYLVLYIFAYLIPTTSFMSYAIINTHDLYFLSQVFFLLFQILNFVFGLCLVYKRVRHLNFHPILIVIVLIPIIGTIFPFYLCLKDKTIKEHYRSAKMFLKENISDS